MYIYALQLVREVVPMNLYFFILVSISTNPKNFTLFLGNIIWLDNVDELCYTQEKWGSLIKFLGDISNIMDQEKDCQVML